MAESEGRGEGGPQKDAMDVLQAWLDEYNRRVQPGIPLGSKGEAGGGPPRPPYRPGPGPNAMLHHVAGARGGRTAVVGESLGGPAPGAARAARVLGLARPG